MRRRPRTDPPRGIPLNLFGIPFGLSGLATAWAYAAHLGLAPPLIRDVLSAVTGAVWIGVLGAYLQAVGRRPRKLVDDLTDPTLGAFSTLALLVPMLIAVDAVLPRAPGTARVIIDVLIAMIVLLGGWLTGQWIYGPLTIEELHPGYFLPTAAGGLLAAAAAGVCGQPRLGQALFGIGIVCWLIIGSMVLARLLFWPPLPAPLTPTIAIEVAPPAAATLAYLSLHGDHIDTAVAALGGYGLLMVLAQIRLLPAYLRLRFGLGFWAFTFSWAVVATAGLHWLADQRPEGWRAGSWLVLAAVTLLVVLIAARTVVALRRGQLLPAGRLATPDGEAPHPAGVANVNVSAS